MDVIPVVDIKGGVSVRAVSGIREKYSPLSSVICGSSDPLEVCESYRNLGAERIYVADLDGIVERKPNIELIKEIVDDVGLPILLDLGVESEGDVFIYGGVTPVLGSESLPSPKLLDALNAGKVNYVVSIDTREGFLLNKMGLGLTGFLGLLRGKVREGREVILLDLSSVGTLSGPNTRLMQAVQEKLPQNRIIYGGGIRDISDIKTLRKAGIQHVLVGSAIHTGKISKEDLRKAHSL